ncbi:Protein of unknown function [Singulisphaera sp. GP187]|uniref:DUF1501 domain-containing protein n=1 Tax=Singulisphaera sp. GP187 TaxID=1882752 RepID=UPI0009279FE4|nr:DUF1501 domain-containing protein [Singulisphaera sp. GP187]SIN73743.1 Protein of unknown function [Singulisphaera sp. GP187]
MLRIMGGRTTTCAGVTRRELLRAGGLSLFGSMTLPRLLRAEAESPAGRAPGRIRSVILINLYGGPSHLDMFDMKPDAPVEIRGEFQPIATSLPGLSICEHLPQTAKWMHRATLIRSVTHTYNSHNPYAVLTGFTGGNDQENYFTKRSDHPGIGAVCQYLGIEAPDMPCHVYLPAHPGYSQGLRRAGPYGGYLGRRFDPLFSVCDPTFDREFNQDKEFYNPIAPLGVPRLPSLEDLPGVTIERLQQRHSLLQQIDRATGQLEAVGDAKNLDHFQRKALSLLASNRARAAFDLSTEPAAVRDQYGSSLFGSSALIARRLVEAGVTFVAVTTESRGGGHWDSHSNNFGMLKSFNLPNLDQTGTALIEDLDRRGLLDSTLVVIMGEMGRAPKVNRTAGRDHWPLCGFALLVGGGVKEGFVLGGSDKSGAYPSDHPVTPGDLVATLYHLLGVDPELMLPDLTGRPIAIAHGGRPIEAILT